LSLDPVASAANATAKAGSEHVTLNASVNSAGVGIDMTGEGDFDNASHEGELQMTFVSGAVSGSIDEVMKDWVIYMRSNLFSSDLPAGKTWLKIDLQKAGKSLGIDFSTLGTQDPTQLLDQLEAVGSVTKVGTEEIGVKTTHYRAAMDVSKIPSGARIEQLMHAQYEPIDIWIDDHDLVRRVRMSYSVRTPGVGRTSTVTTMDFSDFGEQVHVNLPSDADTFDATSLGTKALKKAGT